MFAVAILIIVTLAIIFIVSFVIYRKIPAPKGSEENRISKTNCSSCNKDCSLRKEDE